MNQEELALGGLAAEQEPPRDCGCSGADSFRPVNSRWVYVSLLSAGTVH